MEMHVCLNKQVVDHKNKGYQVKQKDNRFMKTGKDVMLLVNRTPGKDVMLLVNRTPVRKLSLNEYWGLITSPRNYGV